MLVWQRVGSNAGQQTSVFEYMTRLIRISLVCLFGSSAIGSSARLWRLACGLFCCVLLRLGILFRVRSLECIRRLQRGVIMREKVAFSFNGRSGV